MRAVKDRRPGARQPRHRQRSRGRQRQPLFPTGRLRDGAAPPLGSSGWPVNRDIAHSAGPDSRRPAGKEAPAPAWISALPADAQHTLLALSAAWASCPSDPGLPPESPLLMCMTHRLPLRGYSAWQSFSGCSPANICHRWSWSQRCVVSTLARCYAWDQGRAGGGPRGGGAFEDSDAGGPGQEST